MVVYKYISAISPEELNNSVVIACTDEDGYKCILIKNLEQKTTTGNFQTDNLDIKLNRVLYWGNQPYYFHVIRSKKQDKYSSDQFTTIFEYIFKKIESPINDLDLSLLIMSLEDYFKTTPDPNRKQLQIGVFGELFTIQYLYNAGYPEIVSKYHTDFFSKHDVEISSTMRMEIKTTAGEKRIHRFKHDQIFRNDIKVYVSSVLLEKSQEGLTLYQLFEQVLPLFSDPDSILALKKLMIQCGVSEEEQGMSFALEKALNEIRFYDANSLPMIKGNQPDGVTNIEYDVDCSLASEIGVVELSKRLQFK